MKISPFIPPSCIYLELVRANNVVISSSQDWPRDVSCYYAKTSVLRFNKEMARNIKIGDRKSVV